jgi:hypothetical protein
MQSQYGYIFSEAEHARLTEKQLLWGPCVLPLRIGFVQVTTQACHLAFPFTASLPIYKVGLLDMEGLGAIGCMAY